MYLARLTIIRLVQVDAGAFGFSDERTARGVDAVEDLESGFSD
jgi:hypothetical protein